MFQNLKTEEIKKKISKRKQFIIKVVNFIEIVLKKGKAAKRDETIREICDIQDFSFIADTGTDFVGEEYTVKYNSKIVLSVRSQKSAGYQVRKIDENFDWYKLEDLINHAKEILWEFEKEEELKRKKLEDEEENKNRESLLEEAKKLKLL